MVYKLELRDVSWWIVGLPSECNNQILPDTELALVGSNHALNTTDSIVMAIYETIYNYHQTNDGPGKLLTGDVIQGPQYYYYRRNGQSVYVPAMEMIIDSFHVEMVQPNLDVVSARYSKQQTEA